MCKERKDPGGAADRGSKSDRCDHAVMEALEKLRKLPIMPRILANARITDEKVSVRDT